MLLPIVPGRRPAVPPLRRYTFAYDIADQRRTRHVRRTLMAGHTATQYSVMEHVLTYSQRNDMLAELVTLCNLAEDKLAMWCASSGRRIAIGPGTWKLDNCLGNGKAPRSLASLLGTGNLTLVYDIRDPDRLAEVASIVAPQAAAIQRSVYWLRGSFCNLQSIVARLMATVASEDLVWIYPLAHASDLWQLAATPSGLFPTSTEKPARKRTA